MGSPFRLLIFDMDDTLVSARFWTPAETRLFNLLGQPFRPDIAILYKGMNAGDVGRTIHAQLQPANYSAEDCARLLREFLLEIAADEETQPMPGADALLHAMQGKVDMAVASGSPLAVIRLMMERFGWLDCFSLLVTSEDVARGKPSPDVFLEALRRAGHPSRDAVIIEDSLVGVRAAKAAGITCFVAPSSDDPRIVQETDRAFPSLHEMIPVLLGCKAPVVS
jgi:HAD superfamily hydrolase (TIGR01509 family)